MSSNFTYLVTGASRGIGRGFVSALLKKPSTTVIAAVRDPSGETSKTLSDLPKAQGSRIIIVKIDSSVDSDPASAISTLQQEHSIDALDVVIANAGIAHSGSRGISTSADALQEHFAVNTFGPIRLLQAAAPLLKASKSGRPTFIVLSSIIGSIGGMELVNMLPPTMSPYGASKTALNWLIRRIHFEESWLISFVFHPGLVLTDMANFAVAGTGLDPKDMGAISVEESVSKMVKTIDSASRDTSGTFQNYDGTTLPW